jgi:putative ABC transport system permease protein
MWKLAWRGVRFNVGRYVATLIAIMTGVAFFAATGFISDRVINALEGDARRQYANVDAAITVDDSPGSEGSEFADQLRIGGDVVDEIRALPEVAGVAGDLTGKVAFLNADGGTFADGATGRLWIDDEELNPTELVDGSGPRRAGEIAIDQGIADDEDLTVGDEVTILTLAGRFPATITGITKFGNADSEDQDGTVSIAEASAFDWLNSGQVEYEDLFLRTDGSESDLVDAVRSAGLVPPGFVLQGGEAFLQDKIDEAGSFGRFLRTALWVFAGIALFVGGFVIYNTFSVIVAQRLRELAVLAAIGATPRQLKRSLRLEGLAIGLIGSVLGIIVGFGLAFALMALVGALGFDLPGSGIKIGGQTVVLGIFFGTLITFVSVMSPARRAARTEPIEALRQSAVEGASLTRRRIITASVMVGLGMIGMLSATSGAQLGLAAVVLFIGVIVAGPLIAVGGSKLFRPVLRGFGLEGRLAADNAGRNPQRTATTANALLIGVFLVTLVSVAGASVKDFAVSELDELAAADFYILSDGGTIDQGLIRDIEAVDGVTQVVPFRREVVSQSTGSGGSTISAPSALTTGDFDAIGEVANIKFEEGSFDDLGPGGVLVVSQGEDTPEVGSTVTFTNSEGGTADLEVVGAVKSTIDTAVTGGFVDEETFDDFVGDTAPTAGFIDAGSGEQSDVEDAIKDVTDLRPDVTLQAGSALSQLVGQIFDFMINAVNGLLLMSVIVALIGIVNTLSLSILERRRELGLLRVVGMVDKRVQRMVQIESVLISILGTVTGVALGVFTGLSLVVGINTISGAGIAISLPAFTLALILVLGVGLGFLAAFIPSRRSTRLDVLDAIQAT